MVVLGTAETVEHLAARVAGLGWVVERLPTVRAVAIAPARWTVSLRGLGGVSDVVVTSANGVSTGVRVWRRATHPSENVRYWAVGGATAAALRAAGVKRIRRARGEGSEALAQAMANGRRSVLRIRSDRAGAGLARVLRRQGHRVTDLATYRTVERTTISRAERRAVENADALLAASPSALAALGSLLGRAGIRRVRRETLVVTLGPRSARAVRRAGFSRVRVVGPTTQRFTRRLLDGLLHGAERKQ